MADVTILRTSAFVSQPLFPEVDRQPIEQLRMRRPLALGAEVGRRADDARAKEHLPDAIHGDPRGERILAASRSTGPAPAIGRRVGGGRRQHGRRAGRYFLARLAGSRRA